MHIRVFAHYEQGLPLVREGYYWEVTDPAHSVPVDGKSLPVLLAQGRAPTWKAAMLACMAEVEEIARRQIALYTVAEDVPLTLTPDELPTFLQKKSQTPLTSAQGGST
jgi:hypothetical protein